MASIDVHTSTWVKTVRVTTDNGHSFRLPALQNGALAADPDFYNKCDKITESWERYS